jgi:hypothetical protein
MNLQTTLRSPTDADISFVYNSWLKSYRKSDFAKAQCNSVYFSGFKQIVTEVLERSNVIVACDPNDSDLVFGYIVYEQLDSGPLCIHYVYTKFTYRKFGLGTKLFDTVVAATQNGNLPVLVSHYSPKLQKHETPKKLIYNPYVAFYKGAI